jgi:hypothetical protein
LKDIAKFLIEEKKVQVFVEPKILDQLKVPELHTFVSDEDVRFCIDTDHA